MSYEVSRIVLRCQKERDDALRREESARDKLKHLEVSSRSKIQDLKAKLKVVTGENKNLHRTIRKLRLDLGLEGSPRLKGKMTKDIIKELHQQEDQCSHLKEDNHVLSVQLREMVPVIVKSQQQTAELQTQLEVMESKVRSLTKENGRLAHLLQETRKEKEALERAYMSYKKSIEDSKYVTSRSIQTTTSIPVTLPTTLTKRVSRDPSNLQPSQMEKSNGSETSNSTPPSAMTTQKPYYRTLRNQS
ncbi:uncharacterized protein [Dendropsophus ebraccatus]|uniref:uncharacterized protein n=1 Tax=Dendropsophus ebraccatus TaxID=150705 RepID=UPI00383186D6